MSLIEYLGGDASPFENFDEEKAVQSLAFAIRESIYLKTGIKPANIFKKHIPNLLNNLKTEIAGFAMANIKSQIANRYGQNVLNKGKKK